MRKNLHLLTPVHVPLSPLPQALLAVNGFRGLFLVFLSKQETRNYILWFFLPPILLDSVLHTVEAQLIYVTGINSQIGLGRE